jgi:condensin complex subunit 3
LLGKLYISPGSSPDRLRETYTEVSCAVEDGLLTDAPSRNALYKVHVSLGKIVNGLDESKPVQTDLRASVRSSTAPTDRQGTEDRSELGSTSIPEEAEEEEEVAEETVVLRKEEDMSLDEEGGTEAGNDTQAS